MSENADTNDVRVILAGPDIGSLPNDYPLWRMAQDRMDEREKFYWQVIDTCKRAEAAERAREQEYLARIRDHTLLSAKLAALEADAQRWRMLPAFIEEHQINYVRLIEQIDAARAAQDAPNG